MPDGEEERERKAHIDTLVYVFTFSDTILNLPEIPADDARIVEVEQELPADAVPPTRGGHFFDLATCSRLFYWASERGWNYREDLLPVVHHIGRKRQETARAEFTYQDRGSDRYDWPDRPIVLDEDGSAVPLLTIPVGWLTLIDKQIPAGAFRLYLVLWFYAKRAEDDTFRAQVQYPRMREHLDIRKPATIKAWLTKLEAAGYIENADKSNGTAQKGRYLPKTYILKVNPDRMPFFGTPKGVEKPL